jgi:hypothetical protein
MKFPRLAGTGLRKWYVLLPLSVLVLWLGFLSYCAIERERAAAELRKMGFEAGSRDFFQAIRTNWRQVFTSNYYKNRREWSSRVRLMSLSSKDLNACGSALVRFRPREMLLGFCRNLEDVSVLRNLPDLERLDFYECPKMKDVGIVSEFVKLRELTFRDSPSLQTLDIIKSGASLRSLHISECRALNDLNALRQLTSLRSLYLSGVPSIQGAEVLSGLASLEELDLSGCRELSDLKGLYGLKSLKSVNLRNCPKLRAESVVALRVALPNAAIQYP